MYTQIDKQEKQRRGEDDNQKKNEPTLPSALVDSFRMTSSLPCTYLTGRTKTGDTIRTVW